MVHQTFTFTAGPGVDTPVQLPTIVDVNGNAGAFGRRVTIQPHKAAAVDYDVKAPATTNPTFRRVLGQQHVFGDWMERRDNFRFTNQFVSNQIIGYVNPPSVTINYDGLIEG